MDAILAIDSGGTKSDAILVDLKGNVLGHGSCNVEDPCSGRSLSGSGRSRESILKSSYDAISDIKIDCLHLINFNIKGDYFKNNALQIKNYYISESDTIFAAADIDYGIIILAGTGSFVYCRTADNRQIHLDSLGPMLGDYGSAYYVGLLGLKAAARANWHERYNTTLGEKIRKACNADINEFSGLTLLPFVYSNPDRAEIAALAKIVNAEAENGDNISIQILYDAADSISNIVYDAIEILGIQNDKYKIIGAGGLLLHSDIYWNRICERIQNFAPKCISSRLQIPLVVGTALKSFDEITPSDVIEIKNNLKNSFAKYLNDHKTE